MLMSKNVNNDVSKDSPIALHNFISSAKRRKRDSIDISEPMSLM